MSSGSEAVTDQMFFHLHYPESTVKLAEWTHDEMELEAVFCDKVPGHRHSGRRLTDLSVTLPRRPVDDFVWTWYRECLVTQRTLDLFRDHGFTGFDVKPVKARFSRPCAHELPVLWELVVTGWGGVAPPESGVKLITSCDVCKYKKYSACQSLDELFDPSQWDGSDFFFVWPLPKFIWVTERVAQCIRKHKLKGVRLRPPEQVVFRKSEIGFGFGPGRLSYRLPEARAKALGEALGID